jgi:hypothetical protein
VRLLSAATGRPVRLHAPLEDAQGQPTPWVLVAVQDRFWSVKGLFGTTLHTHFDSWARSLAWLPLTQTFRYPGLVGRRVVLVPDWDAVEEALALGSVRGA